MKRLWIGTLTICLAACNPAEAASDMPTDTPSPRQDEIAPATTIPEDIDSLEGDSRPLRLRSVTQGWATDWTRHTVDYEEILSGGPPRDGIPSIDNPVFLDQDEVDWLAETEPVIALEINGDARAYPLQIITWHEVVNDVVGDVPVAVTFCPLCNSALVFDRRVNGETYEFGVSGLLRNSDLIMYDRTTESLWQQFTGEGIVGLHAGDRLEIVPAGLVSYKEFSDAYPSGRVLSRDTGFTRSYGLNPYEGYDSSSVPFLFTGDSDQRLPAMERIVGVNFGGEQKAFPYTALAETPVINDEVGGQPFILLYAFGTNSALDAQRIAEARDVGASGLFSPIVDGEQLVFAYLDGAFVDEQTGSTWSLSGQAVSGALEGKALDRLVSSDHFWFSWAAFYPETSIYTP